MKTVNLFILRTVEVFAIGGLLVGFMPLSTPGPQNVMDPEDSIQSRSGKLTGYVEILFTEPGDPCIQSQERYLHPGTKVVIQNSDRHPIATGFLEVGTPEPLQAGFSKMTCKFPLVVENIPELQNYIIKLEGGEEFSYSRQQFEQKKWQVELTLFR
ncbi:hypothetical protein J0895_22885 [Phormidium pseudopriestleyi FRX01]|uniref:Uncharacterized protein n=1 Tax=Phormidium pseudopriestleyi FRX01 TaxID=1759528 RepID=A0ABS3FXK1_9CYAN|nr:hypothetical protein [Phormidium pseudopriestleyi]MBO0351874.1 hypothetical protein [Phormidium pseudopriestleyi FRX01]